jgi:putative inorganic carbon (HCO3(-)) transporter
LAVLAALSAAAAIAGDDFSRVFFALTGLVAVAAIAWPVLGLGAALVVSPTFGWVVFGPDVSAFQLLLPCTALGALLAYRGELSPLARKLLTRPEILLVLAFFLVICMATAARWGFGELSYVRNYAGAVLLMVVTAVLLRSVQRRTLVVALVIAGCVATALVGLIQLLTSDALVSSWVLPSLRVVRDTYDRFAAPWGLGAEVANFAKDVLVGLLLAIPFLVRGQDGLSRRLLWPAVLVLGLALIMSGGRADWLAGVVALGYLGLVLHRHRAFLIGALTMMAVLALCIARPLTPVDVQAAVGLPKPVSRLAAESLAVSGARDELSVEVSNNLRRRLTHAGLEMVRDYPVFGVGPGAFRDYVDVYEPVKPGAVIDARPRLPAHNVFLELWADSGTPAFLLYLAFLGAVLLVLERQRRRTEGVDQATSVAVTAALIGLNVTSLFHNYQTENLLWALLGLAVSLELWPRGSTREEPVPTGAPTSPAVSHAAA